jgi:hypothetical protein
MERTYLNENYQTSALGLINKWETLPETTYLSTPLHFTFF